MKRLGGLEVLLCFNLGCHQILSLIFGKHLAAWMLVFQPEEWEYICFGELLNDGIIMKTLVFLLLEAFINSCVQIFKYSLLDRNLEHRKKMVSLHGAY